MAAPDPLNKHKNWVRAATGLQYLKEGLEGFVEDEIVKLQTTFLQDIRTSNGLQNSAICNLCALENILQCPTKGFCYRSKGVCRFHAPRVTCPNLLCDNIASKVVDEHRYTRRAANGNSLNYEAPSWRNTDVSKWCSTPWEIAKCFMAASGYADKMSVQETDCSGILGVIINCMSIQNSLSTVIDPPNDIFCKMRDIRNTIMHSATLEITDYELQEYINDMIDILNDSKQLQNHPDAVTAKDKLDQIKTRAIVISSLDELKLRKSAIEAIEQKQKELLDQCQKNQTELQLKVDLAMTSINQAEIKSKHTQDDLQSKVDETMTSLTQAEIKSKQTYDDLQSKVIETMSSITKNQDICQHNQKDLQSRFDQTMFALSQAEKKCQQNQDNIGSSQSQLLILVTALQKQMQQVVEAVQQCQLDIKTVKTDLQGVLDKHKERIPILENRQLLKNRLREVYKLFQSTIPLSPILKNMDVDINVAYTELIIRRDWMHDPSIKLQKKIHSTQSETHSDTITAFEDIFLSNKKPCKNIFVIGDAGIGKTTWCLNFLNIWSDGKTISADMDKEFLQGYDYVFYVQLRHTKTESQIYDMIRKYLFPADEPLMRIAIDVLENEPEKCIVLLDGLDEWKLSTNIGIHNKGLPCHRIGSEYTTLITSRSWKLELLRLKSPDIDKAVEIKGLCRKGIFKLTKHIVEQLNSIRRKDKNYKLFIEFIEKKEMPLIEVPLMLTIFVYLWYDDNLVSATLAELFGELTEVLIKYAEGDKRKVVQNLGVSKLADIHDIHTIKKSWSKIELCLPKCLKGVLCIAYGPLLYSLGHLAFDSLLSENRHTCLVFTVDSIGKYLREEELEVALRVGIFSQSQSIEDCTEEKLSVSFLHKTIQEFLAAVYMVSEYINGNIQSTKNKFKTYCYNIKANLFEIQIILLFLSGMIPEFACELIQTLIQESSDEQDLRHLHEILLKCSIEEHLYSNESNHIYIENHFLNYKKGPSKRLINEMVKYIHQNNNHIKLSLFMKYCQTQNQLSEACQVLRGIQTLNMLTITKSSLMLLGSTKEMFIQTLVVENCGPIIMPNYSKKVLWNYL